MTAAIDGNGLFSFGLDTSSSNSVLYSAKEGANPPQLSIISTNDGGSSGGNNGDGSGNGSGDSGGDGGSGDSGGDSPANQPPTVDAGADQSVVISNMIDLVGTALDDGLPNPLAFTWTRESGPGSVNFGNDGALQTTARFSAVGAYVLRLTVNDGQFTVYDELTVTVTEANASSGSARTFLSVADAMVKSSSPTRNYGDADTIRLRDTEPVYKSYIQFNVTDINEPVQNARLRLYVTDASDVGGAVYAVSNNGSNGAPWLESEITWENAPLVSGSPLSVLGEVNSDVWVEFDVTAAIAGNGLYSFGLETTSSNSVLYSAKESGQPPLLVINADATAAQVLTANAQPSSDLDEELLDEMLRQELDRSGGSIWFYLPIAETAEK